MQRALSYRIIDGPVDLDVTSHVDADAVSWSAVGGCQTCTLRIDLPLSTFPTLSEQSRLVVSSHTGTRVWEGFCSDPGAIDDDDGEGFDLVAHGTAFLASDRIAPLVYVDTELGSWQRWTGSVESARTDQIAASTEGDDAGPARWRIGHTQGYAIDTGATGGIEYVSLRHADQPIGAVRFTATGGATDAGFVLRFEALDADGATLSTLQWPLSAASATRTLRAGADFATGCAAVRLSVARVGAATNNPVATSYVDLSAVTVWGARVDRTGAAVDPTTTVTSSAVVEDLIGRGMLPQVDPGAALIEPSPAIHSQLAWPEGIRASRVLDELRAADTDMMWAYGPSTATGGFEFAWRAWPTGTASRVRYVLDEDDEITRPGGDDEAAHRIGVYWTEDGVVRHLTVGLDMPGGARIRDADPINLGDATRAEAETAGVEALEALSQPASANATVARLVRDLHTGLDVEPWEIEAGHLAQIAATGEIMRITEVEASTTDGASARLVLGDPAATIEDRLAAFVLRGEDPTRPPIVLPPAPPTTGPGTGSPQSGSDGEPPAHSPTPRLTPSFDALFIEWDEVPNTDPVTYDVYISASVPIVPSPSTFAGSVAGTTFVARRLPSGAPFVHGVNYTVGIVARDPDGEADMGAYATGQALEQVPGTSITDHAISTPKLATNAITTALLLANDAWVGALRTVDLSAETITGPKIQTNANSTHTIKLDGWTNTLRAYGASSTTPTFEINGNTGAVTATNFSGTGVFTAFGQRATRLSGQGLEFATSSTSPNWNTAAFMFATSSALHIYGPGSTTTPVDIIGTLKNYSMSGAPGDAIDTRGGYLRSPATVLLSSGAVANVRINIDPDSAVFAMIGSSRQIKLAIEDIDAAQVDALLGLNVRTWFDRHSAEALAEWNETGDDEVLSTAENLRRIPGLIAEEVHDAGATTFVEYGPDGEPIGLMYDRIGVAWIPLVRDHSDELAEHRSQIAALEAQNADLAARLTALEAS